MMKWLRTMLVGYLLDNINRYWKLQVAGTSKKDTSWILIGATTIAVLVLITIAIAKLERIKDIWRNFINDQVNIGRNNLHANDSDSDDSGDYKGSSPKK